MVAFFYERFKGLCGREREKIGMRKKRPAHLRLYYAFQDVARIEGPSGWSRGRPAPFLSGVYLTFDRGSESNGNFVAIRPFVHLFSAREKEKNRKLAA